MKSLISTLIAVLGLSIHSFGASEISAELDTFMNLEPTRDEYIQDNLYVGWKGIKYPGKDWRTIYGKSFKQNEKYLNQKLREGRIATNFIRDPLQSMYKLPLNREQGLIYLSHHLKKNEKLLEFKPILVKNKNTINARDYFFCREYLNPYCLGNTRTNQAYIKDTISLNLELLTRFRELAEQSKYNYALTYNDFNASLAMRYSTNMAQIFQLNLSEAIIDIIDNNIDEGLDKLVLARKWLDISFREKSKPSTLYFIVNTNFTQYLDQTMSTLLSSKYLDNYLDDGRVEMIVRPFPQNIGQKINAMIILEMLQSFRSIGHPFVKIYRSDSMDQKLKEEDEYIILLYLQDYETKLPPILLEVFQSLDSKNQVSIWAVARQLNQLKANVFARSINNNSVVAPFADRLDSNNVLAVPESELIKWYAQFFQRIKMTPKEAITYLNTKYPSTDFFNDYYHFLQVLSAKNSEQQQYFTTDILEDILSKEVSAVNAPLIRPLIKYTEFRVYWARLYEQQNYHQLVYLKYLIIKNKIKDQNILKLLVSMGDLAKNTITHEPYLYDMETKLLSTPLPSVSKYLPSSVKEARIENRKINQFQVRLP